MERSKQRGRTSINRYFVSAVGVFMLAFVTAFMAGSILAPVDEGSADTVNVALTPEGYYISTESAGSVDFDITAPPVAKTFMQKDTIVTKTNISQGYKLYLSTEIAEDYEENGTVIPGNALHLDGDRTSSPFISPATGSVSELDINSWGYAESDSESAFSAVPLHSSPVLIQTTDAENEEGVEKDIYYGIKADMGMPAGTYSNKVVYTAISNVSASGVAALTLSPNTTTNSSGGDLVTIKTTLYSNYAFSTSDITVMIGGKTCDVQTVGVDDNLKTVTLTCKTAALEIGAHDVVVKIPMYEQEYTLEKGFLVISPCSANTVCYFANGGSGSMGSYAKQTTVYLTTENAYVNTAISSSTTMLTLYAPNFYRDGYGFTGWNTSPDGTGTQYGPNERISWNSSLSSTGLSLYAQWVSASADMQNWSGCESMSTGQVIGLKDVRDGNVYAVAKLADDKCWMIENLRLGGTEAMELTGETTALASESSKFTLPASVRSFGTANTTVQINTNNTDVDDTTLTDSPVLINTWNYRWYEYGNYYSWPAATATTTVQTTNYSNVDTSICPKGWKLPSAYNGSASSYGDFLTLNYIVNGNYTASSADSDNNFRKYPINFTLGGGINNTGYVRGIHHNLWSTTSYSASEAYEFNGGPNGMSIAYRYTKSVMWLVRCLAS